VWGGSGRRTRTDTQLVPQCPNPHLGRLSLSGAILYHVIRWSVQKRAWVIPATVFRQKREVCCGAHEVPSRLAEQPAGLGLDGFSCATMLAILGVCVAAERICAAAHICSIATQTPSTTPEHKG
jgi:hypothetical protein